MSLRPVSLDIDYEGLLSSEFQRQPPQNAIPVYADRAIAVVRIHDHALMQYVALSVGPSKSP